ncbi:unnamed protein product, partial [Chrysoparadoxa australica]
MRDRLERCAPELLGASPAELDEYCFNIDTRNATGLNTDWMLYHSDSVYTATMPLFETSPLSVNSVRERRRLSETTHNRFSVAAAPLWSVWQASGLIAVGEPPPKLPYPQPEPGVER